ncbi:FxsA family protein [Rhodobacteraceae bacterium 2CG4]|uniref:FxsA family protein n=1 Tax=Halovulum marinum TaxID=2662447 RepID=A0A6L5Z276_9RHOB|nr:FxsA family protein [Halovulum marinum]
MLFAAFVAVPIVEIALFIQVGGWIGLWPTLAVVVLTAIAGTALMRAQGLATLAELQRRMNAGENPTATLAHGAMILFAGALLLTPGFFTDTVGFLLLLPPVRASIIRSAAANISGKVAVFRTGGGPAGPGPGAHPGAGDGSDGPIDAEYQRLDPDEVDEDGPRGSSGWTRQR